MLRNRSSSLRASARCVLAAIAEAVTIIGIPFAFKDIQLAQLALAPMAVKPRCQKRGTGGRLIAAALDEARAAGGQAVIVLGHPGYYPRFGFSAALARKR